MQYRSDPHQQVPLLDTGEPPFQTIGHDGFGKKSNKIIKVKTVAMGKSIHALVLKLVFIFLSISYVRGLCNLTIWVVGGSVSTSYLFSISP